MVKKILTLLLCVFSFQAMAQSFLFTDYFPSITPGDKWHYTGVAKFTLGLSEIKQGPYKGLKKFGNERTGIVFDVESGVVTWYDYDNNQLVTKMVFEKAYQAGTYHRIGNRHVVFMSVPELTVAAGTFNEVIAMVWLTPVFEANIKNRELGISSAVTDLAVSDIDYYAKGVGLIRYEAINPVSGAVDGEYSLTMYEPAYKMESRENQSMDSALFSFYKVSPFKK